MGTRIADADTNIAALIERIDVVCGSGMAIVSAYWDARAFDTARDLALRVGGIASMILWVGGAVDGAAWRAVEDHLDDRMLDIAFVGSASNTGIFHPKAVGITTLDDQWTHALVGSANFTRAGHEHNVELGVLIENEPEALARLTAWFDSLRGEATNAHDLLADHHDLAERAEQFARSQDTARRRGFDDVLDPLTTPPIEMLRRSSRERRRDAAPNLRSCHGYPEQISRYLDVLVDRLSTERPKRRLPGLRVVPGESIRRVHLTFDNGRIELRMYPGDVLDQARVLYARPNHVHALLDLQDDGWQMRPNFHWGFRESGLVHVWPMPGTLDIGAYSDYWIDNIESTKQVREEDYVGYLEHLQHDHIVDGKHRAVFDATFPGTRSTATPRPGIAARYEWQLDTAQLLDDAGEFLDAIRTRANQMLDTLGEPSLA